MWQPRPSPGSGSVPAGPGAERPARRARTLAGRAGPAALVPLAVAPGLGRLVASGWTGPGTIVELALPGLAVSAAVVLLARSDARRRAGAGQLRRLVAALRRSAEGHDPRAVDRSGRGDGALAALGPTVGVLLDADVVLVFTAADGGAVLAGRHARPGAPDGWPERGSRPEPAGDDDESERDADRPSLAEVLGAGPADRLAPALAAGHACFVPRVAVSDLFADASAEAAALASVLVAPLGIGDRSAGVVLAGWYRPVRELAGPVIEAVELVVREAAREHEREQQVEQMSRDARTDPLTGLLNRRAIEEELAGLDAGDVVAVVDPDHLSRVNEQGGHAAGDRTLRSLAACLADFCRRNDWCGRLGEEEFLLVVRRSGAHPARAVDRLRLRWQALEPTTTFSAGVAVHRAGIDAWQTVTHAEAALRRAKELGRDRVEVYVRSRSGR
jgi:diguanylate cyclase (GGDEF)-like protein